MMGTLNGTCGWPSRAWVKRQTAKGWRKATKAALAAGGEPPSKRPIKGWCD